MSDDLSQTKEIAELKTEISNLKNEINKIRKDLVPLIKNVISWHAHGSNGKMYWEYPDELKKGIVSQMSRPTDEEIKVTFIESEKK